MTLKDICEQAHKMAVEKGFWDTPRNDGECIALMHSELSDVLEGLRHGNPKSDKIPEFTSEEEEYADLIIRVCDTAGAKGLRLEQAIQAKMQYNSSRPHKHGKTF